MMDKNRLKELAGVSLNEANKTDTVLVDIPLLIRLLEWAREDAKNDMQLHKVAENLIKLSKNGESLSMINYNDAIKDADTMNKEPDKKDG